MVWFFWISVFSCLLLVYGSTVDFSILSFFSVTSLNSVIIRELLQPRFVISVCAVVLSVSITGSDGSGRPSRPCSLGTRPAFHSWRDASCEPFRSRLSPGRLLWWLGWWRIHLQCSRPGYSSWVGKISWRRQWQSIPIFLPGEVHGQRSLVSYSSWGHKELDTHEWLALYQVNKVPSIPSLMTVLKIILHGFGLMHFIYVAKHFIYVAKHFILAAKSLQLCPTLCDPIDGSPPGSPVPGILQARTLEWVAISFSNICWGNHIYFSFVHK